MAAIDAEALYADGTLRAVTSGLVKRYRRLGQVPLILTELAIPICRLAESLRRMGQGPEADSVLAHAVHDGIDPSVLAQAVAATAQPDVILPPAIETVTVGPNGELRAGPPPAATDAASAAELANYLRSRLT